MNRNSRDHRAPEGSSCAEHPGRKAHFSCPRCGNAVCLACWQPSFARCQRCLLQHPGEAAPPIPWERPATRWIVRLFATLGTAFQPIATAPAFASDEVRPAARFALFTAVPAAMLGGLMPHTRTLLFEHMQVRLLGAPTGFEIALDVIRAMAVEGALAAVRFGCLFFPFVSLVRAYTAPHRHNAAMRMMLYRAWILPAIVLLYYYGALWSLPPNAAEHLETAPVSFVLCGSITLVLLAVLMMAMSATARIACGLGPWLSMVVVMVPVTLLLFVQELVSAGMVYLLPAMPLIPT